jgi:hypothetical protein
VLQAKHDVERAQLWAAWSKRRERKSRPARSRTCWLEH